MTHNFYRRDCHGQVIEIVQRFDRPSPYHGKYQCPSCKRTGDALEDAGLCAECVVAAIRTEPAHAPTA